jgi:hypothetical protein
MNTRRALAAVPFCVLSAACGAGARPAPATPTGFLLPPRTRYAGVLTAGARGETRSAEITYPSGTANTGDEALVRLGPDCLLSGKVIHPPYADVPGAGYVRQGGGLLAVAPGTPCVLGDGGSLHVTAGTVSIADPHLVELSVAGRANDGERALRFTGTLTEEGEDMTSVGPHDVEVHFVAERSFKLTRGETDFVPRLEAARGHGWRGLCEAPCVTHVAPDTRLRVGGAGILDSSDFVVPSDRARVVLRADGTSAGGRTFGWVFFGTGALVAALGATFFTAGAARHDEAGLELSGALVAATSLPFVIIGLVTLTRSGTSVVTDSGDRLARTAPPPGFTF